MEKVVFSGYKKKINLTYGHSPNGNIRMATTISFSTSNFDKIKLGKRTTVRLGQKSYSLGEAVFTVDDIPSDLKNYRMN